VTLAHCSWAACVTAGWQWPKFTTPIPLLWWA